MWEGWRWHGKLGTCERAFVVCSIVKRYQDVFAVSETRRPSLVNEGADENSDGHDGRRLCCFSSSIVHFGSCMHLCYYLCAGLIPEIRILDPLKRVAAIHQAIVNHGFVVIIAIFSCYEVDRVI